MPIPNRTRGPWRSKRHLTGPIKSKSRTRCFEEMTLWLCERAHQPVTVELRLPVSRPAGACSEGCAVTGQISEPFHLPDEAWRTTAALRMLRNRDFRSIFNLAQLHGISPADIALKAGLAEDLVRKVATGDATVTSDQIERIADALSMPPAAREALGLPPQACDPTH